LGIMKKYCTLLRGKSCLCTMAEERPAWQWDLLCHQPMPSGPLKGQYIDPEELQEAVNLYYEISGWSKEGKPTRGKLVEMNLEWLIDED